MLDYLELNKEGWGRLTSGHPWILRRHIKSFAKGTEDILSVPCILPLGEHWFLVSPQSEIMLRRLGPALRHWPDVGIPRSPIQGIEAFEKCFFQPLKDLFIQNFKYKSHLMSGETCFRWIFSESDLLPGLIVDRYENKFVSQILSAPVDLFWPVFRRALVSAAAECLSVPIEEIKIIEKRDAQLRKKEGLSVEDRPLLESSPQVVSWNGLRWWMQPGASQKTGSYLDQRENHKRTLHWVKQLGLLKKDSKAWDLCSFEGGFGLHLAKAGLQVLSVDQSEAALDAALQNMSLNDISGDLFRTHKADIFHFLKERFVSGEKVEVIVLDPPPFSRSKSELHSAMRGYKELNLRALHAIKPGGLLVTCSCSHHVGAEDFRAMLAAASHDARRIVRVLESAGPSPDHGPNLSVGESTYLQALFLSVY